MFTFIKKLFGFDQETMKAAGVQTEQAPYKVPEPVAPPTPALLPVEIVPVTESLAVPVIVEKLAVAEVKTAPAKAIRKPRAPKASVVEKPVVKKAVPVKKTAAIKATRKVK